MVKAAAELILRYRKTESKTQVYNCYARMHRVGGGFGILDSRGVFCQTLLTLV
jgi:hypothetical protein